VNNVYSFISSYYTVEHFVVLRFCVFYGAFPKIGGLYIGLALL